jgi:hypothetical protein
VWIERYQHKGCLEFSQQLLTKLSCVTLYALMSEIFNCKVRIKSHQQIDDYAKTAFLRVQTKGIDWPLSQ